MGHLSDRVFVHGRLRVGGLAGGEYLLGVKHGFRLGEEMEFLVCVLAWNGAI